MITWFNPTSRGMTAVHWSVPKAVPDRPVLVYQVTPAIPERSNAVPLNVRYASVVAIDVVDG